MLSYKFRLYPSKTVEAKLNEHIELCLWRGDLYSPLPLKR
ncbi:helix-turn-helix domain-containing protein [Methermicoccus shengliensis]|uniref:Helix-turn-helix domain-containing protein n=1 Tax=Methermicoccus shengliensis TaxID=660064 RepID=A0A832W0P4_9EURY|nr:helix-turn-helix domain-containing protein [Methermicoccus shengliensis]